MTGHWDIDRIGITTGQGYRHSGQWPKWYQAPAWRQEQVDEFDYWTVSDIDSPLYQLSTTSTWVPSGFSGYVHDGLTQKLCLKKYGYRQ